MIFLLSSLQIAPSPARRCVKQLVERVGFVSGWRTRKADVISAGDSGGGRSGGLAEGGEGEVKSADRFIAARVNEIVQRKLFAFVCAKALGVPTFCGPKVFFYIYIKKGEKVMSRRSRRENVKTQQEVRSRVL